MLLQFQPKKGAENIFDEISNIISKRFFEKSFLFKTRWQYLNLVKKNEDFVSYLREYVKLKLNELTVDMLKSLGFLQGITVNKNPDIRFRILTKLWEDQNLTLYTVTEGRQRIIKQ